MIGGGLKWRQGEARETERSIASVDPWYEDPSHISTKILALMIAIGIVMMIIKVIVSAFMLNYHAEPNPLSSLQPTLRHNTPARRTKLKCSPISAVRAWLAYSKEVGTILLEYLT